MNALTRVFLVVLLTLATVATIAVDPFLRRSLAAWIANPLVVDLAAWGVRFAVWLTPLLLSRNFWDVGSLRLPWTWTVFLVLPYLLPNLLFFRGFPENYPMGANAMGRRGRRRLGGVDFSRLRTDPMCGQPALCHIHFRARVCTCASRLSTGKHHQRPFRGDGVWHRAGRVWQPCLVHSSSWTHGFPGRRSKPAGNRRYSRRRGLRDWDIDRLLAAPEVADGHR